MREEGFSFFLFFLVVCSVSLFLMKVIDYFYKVSLDNRIKRSPTCALSIP